MQNTWFSWQQKVLSINCLIQTRSKKTEIVGVQDNCLKIRIKAMPIDGKANAELIKFLANSFGVSQSKIEILHGVSSKRKQVTIHEPTKFPEALQTSLLTHPIL